MAMASAADAGRLVRTLFLVAMALFVVTIVIGIINGLDLYEFDRNQLLTHVHAGTVGWLSLAIIGSAMWMSRSGNRTMALAFAILIPAYVLAFYSGNLPARAATGVALLLAMAWLFIWSWRWALAERSLPALAVTLGICLLLLRRRHRRAAPGPARHRACPCSPRVRTSSARTRAP